MGRIKAAEVVRPAGDQIEVGPTREKVGAVETTEAGDPADYERKGAATKARMD